MSTGLRAKLRARLATARTITKKLKHLLLNVVNTPATIMREKKIWATKLPNQIDGLDLTLTTNASLLARKAEEIAYTALFLNKSDMTGTHVLG